ncbi:MAG: enoyl-CoA hydratase/isomerase family protein [Planctomycetota bacterium]|jgi:enoyl-CoA hydratase
MEPRILVERDGSIETLTLNRPDAMNALDREMVGALHAELDRLEVDRELTAVILTGSGEKAFVAGADIAELRARRAPEAFDRVNQHLFRRVAELPMPTIAAVRGFALGGGCELALSCDLRVASPSARFGQPEVGLGIIPGAGATHRLARLVGLGRARELIFTGAIIDAAEAHRIGLVNHLSEDEESLLDGARELAGRIARNATGAVRLAKVAVNHALDPGERGRDLLEVLAQALCFESEEKEERMTRFLERKKK